jgi:hypothetical protein
VRTLDTTRKPNTFSRSQQIIKALHDIWIEVTDCLCREQLQWLRGVKLLQMASGLPLSSK